MKRFAILICVVLLTALSTYNSSASVIHVKWNSTGTALDGNSWETAYHSVQEGINAASTGDEVWVAAGTYAEAITTKDGIGLYGGFTGSEVLRSQRNSKTNITTINGKGAAKVVDTPSIAGFTVIDGFTITNGHDGITTDGMSAQISNNTITGVVTGVNLNNYSSLYAPHYTVTNNLISKCGFAGIYVYLYSGGSADITGNTVADCITESSASYGLLTDSSTVNVANNIFVFNDKGIRKNSGTLTLSHNCVFGNTTANYDLVSPGTGDIQNDPMFANRAVGDYHIRLNSPCRNAGDNSAQGMSAVDLDGQGRIYDGMVDIGADESHGEFYPNLVFRVRGGSQYNGPGNDWPHAYRNFAGALKYAISGDEIWASAGYYGRTVTLNEGVRIYGGFAGFETSRDQRDYSKNRTVIGDNVDVGFWAPPGITPATLVDGFTIDHMGYGVNCNASSPTINNCTMVCFSGSYTSSGVYCINGASPVITNCKMYSNAYGVYSLSSSPTVRNSSIVSSRDGVMCSSSPAATIDSNSISNCTDTGIYIFASNGCSVTNNSVAHNFQYGIYIVNSSITATGNTISNSTQGIYASRQGIYANNCNSLIKSNAIDSCMMGIYSGNNSTASICANTITNSTYSGIMISGSPGCNATNNLIINSKNNGIYFSTSSATAINNTIIKSTTGIIIDSSAPTLKNNLIASNATGILLGPTCFPVLKNNCLFGNTTATSGMTDPTGKNGNVSVNPAFMDYAKGDYRLTPGSACIDAGTSDGAPVDDLNEVARPKDGNGDSIAAVDIGCYEAPANYVTTAQAKALRDGTPVGIIGVSTAVFDGNFYMEDSQRVTGIGVVGEFYNWGIGDVDISAAGRQLTVEGHMATVDGERVISANSVTEGISTSIPAPWCLNIDALGGGPSGLQQGVTDYRLVKNPLTGEWERKLFSYGGASNIGLLVKMTGKVTNKAEGFFYLDGTAVYDDGNPAVKGLKVDWPFTAAMPDDGKFVEIAGISSCTMKNGHLVRLLKPVSADAVKVLR